MLVTQRDIQPCGLLPLTLRRWGATCAENDLKAWLEELEAARYVLIDEHTEELLVRTFMKWDAGHKHAKRRLAVIASALAIRSQSIRSAALEELAKLGVSVANTQAAESLRSVVTEVSTDRTPETALPEREPFGDAEPPSMFCSKHQPDGTDEPCGPCGTAKLRYTRWMKSATARAAELRRAREQCSRCHGNVWLEDGTKCDHKETA